MNVLAYTGELWHSAFLIGNSCAATATPFLISCRLNIAAPPIIETLYTVKYRLEDILQTEVDLIHGPLNEGSMIELDGRISLYGA